MANESTADQYVRLAWNAVSRAATLAGHAESAAHSSDRRHYAEPLAAAGALWADVARSYAAIAGVLPDPLPELSTGGTEF
jgi:hypothetical protein